MRIDAYTKVVLTVIAACLLWQCAMAAGRVAYAQRPSKEMTDAAKPVVIVGFGEMNDRGEIVNLYTKSTSRGVVTDPTANVRLPYSMDSPLPVGVHGAVSIAASPQRPVAVALTQINRAGGPWDSIATKVDPAGTRSTPGEIR